MSSYVYLCVGIVKGIPNVIAAGVLRRGHPTSSGCGQYDLWIVPGLAS